MKKLFAIALIAVSFAACNSAETSTEEATADSLANQVETLADSAHATIDSAAATVDSAAAAAVDSAAH